MTEGGDSKDARDYHEARERARKRLAARQQGRVVRKSLFERVAESLVDTLHRIVNKVGIKGIVLAGVVVIAFVFIVVGIGVGIQSCSSEQTESTPALEDHENTAESTEIPELNIPDSIDAELAASLKLAANDNPDVTWIANHADEYAMDGEVVQAKLLKLATTEPASLDFVRAFLDEYPSESGQSYSDEVSQGFVPRMYQWDKRWGYTVYSSTTFALTGCCPTALSMVYMGLTGHNDLSPYDMGLRAQEGGYMSQYNGTDAAFLVDTASSLGLTVSSIGVDSDSLRGALENKQLVICNVGPGDFTEAGHYFVITGINEDGTIAINDPYSANRSEQLWDMDLVLSQTIALYAYDLA